MNCLLYGAVEIMHFDQESWLGTRFKGEAFVRPISTKMEAFCPESWTPKSGHSPLTRSSSAPVLSISPSETIHNCSVFPNIAYCKVGTELFFHFLTLSQIGLIGILRR